MLPATGTRIRPGSASTASPTSIACDAAAPVGACHAATTVVSLVVLPSSARAAGTTDHAASAPAASPRVGPCRADFTANRRYHERIAKRENAPSPALAITSISASIDRPRGKRAAKPLSLKRTRASAENGGGLPTLVARARVAKEILVWRKPARLCDRMFDRFLGRAFLWIHGGIRDHEHQGTHRFVL